MKWKKIRDFKDKINLPGLSTDDSSHEIYELSENFYKIEFRIKCDLDKNISIWVVIYNDEIFENLKQHLHNSKLNLNLLDNTPIHHNYIYTSSNNLKQCMDLISVINHFFPFKSEIRNNIYDTLINNFHNKFWAHIVELVKDKEFDKAYKEVLTPGNTIFLYKLGKLFQQNKQWQEALLCYQTVINHHAQEFSNQSYQAIFNILAELLIEAENGAIKLTPQQYRDYYQIQLNCLLHQKKLSAYDQSSIDQKFYQLCGYKEEITPIIQNVGLDSQTLINISDQMYRLNAENSQLKNQRKMLLEELKEAKKSVQNLQKAQDNIILKPDFTPPVNNLTEEPYIIKTFEYNSAYINMK